MFRKERMNVFTNNDMLKQYYSNEYPMYKEELKREADREVKAIFEQAMIY